MVTDCKSLAAVMGGHDVLKENGLYSTLSNILKKVDAMLQKGWMLNNEVGDPWTWRPRELNKAPDAICNYVMDHRCNMLCVGVDATRFQNYPNVYVSSDGGCRREEGISATGWVIRAVGRDSKGIVRMIEIARGGTFYSKTCSSFQIEAFAMDEATNAFLEYFRLQ